METEQIIKKAAEPHLIASAKEAKDTLTELNSLLRHLRLELNESELISDLHKNKLLQQTDKSIPLKESEWKISEEYRNWKKKRDLVSDLRAVRRNLERHADVLINQEKYANKTPSYLG
jgi:IS4 transposase